MFDFSQHMDRLCRDIVQHTPCLNHIDMRQVAVSAAQCRRNSRHGLYARLAPLRFAGGARTAVRKGRKCRVQSVHVDGREVLYVLTFYLPRFQDRPAREALRTVFHELYHISERCDGDIRRLPGRNYAHSHSRRLYDEHMDVLVEQYLAAQTDAACREFLGLSFSQLEARYGTVCGLRVPIPRLIPE